MAILLYVGSEKLTNRELCFIKNIKFECNVLSWEERWEFKLKK